MIPEFVDGQLPPGEHVAAHPRTAQKDRYGGELFPNVEELASGSLFVDFFQTDRDTGLPKGIVVLDLRSFAP